MASLKILIYTHEFPPFKGGAGVYSYDLAVSLGALSQDIHILTTDPVAPQDRGRDIVGLRDLKMHYLQSWQTDPDAACLRLVALQLRFQFDIVLVSERRAQEIASGIPLGMVHFGVVFHGTELLDYFGGRQPALLVSTKQMASFYQRAAICIAVSQATRDLAETLMHGKLDNLVVVRNGINLDRLAPANSTETARLRKQYGTQAEIVFCLGRLALDKGQDVLIKAFAKVKQVRPNVHLLIGGDGPGMVDLAELRSRLALDHCVEFLGEIPASKLPTYFDACDLFALTSRSENRWEGFGLVYLEAGYYRKAVVGGNEGGVPEAIADQVSGLIVPPRDENAIASAILSLLGDTRRRNKMGMQGRERVLSHFNAKRMAEETLANLALATPIRSGMLEISERLALFRYLLAMSLRIGRRWLRRVVR